MTETRKLLEAAAYLRAPTPSGHADREWDNRQRAIIAAFAKTHGYTVVAEFRDEAAHGVDSIPERPGFRAMLDYIAGNGLRYIIVESPYCFARGLTAQATGNEFLQMLGISLIPASAPGFFTEDTQTALLVRQVFRDVARLEKIWLVAKLKAARMRQKADTGKCGGRRRYAEVRPEVVALAKELHAHGMSLRKISTELAARGYLTAGQRPYVATAVRSMLR